MKILAIDFNIQLGHVNFNRKILNLLNKQNEVTFLSSFSYVQKIGFKNSISIDDKRFEYNSKYGFVLKQILLIKYVIKTYVRKLSCDKIVILGYENMSFSLAWSGIKKPTFIIAHNNFSRGKLSLALFKKISKNVVHIVLEDFIKGNIKKMIKNKIEVIPHPLNPNIELMQSKKQNIVKGQIFCPSSSSDVEEVLTMANYIKDHQEFILFAKVNTEQSFVNVHFSSYFDNYEELLLNSEFIYISFKYSNRVSGVFFDAMALGKTIITSKDSGQFMREMANKYHESVHLVNSISDVKNKLISADQQKKEYDKFIACHSDESLESILNNILNNY